MFLDEACRQARLETSVHAAFVALSKANDRACRMGREEVASKLLEMMIECCAITRTLTRDWDVGGQKRSVLPGH